MHDECTAVLVANHEDERTTATATDCAYAFASLMANVHGVHEKDVASACSMNSVTTASQVAQEIGIPAECLAVHLPLSLGKAPRPPSEETPLAGPAAFLHQLHMPAQSCCHWLNQLALIGSLDFKFEEMPWSWRMDVHASSHNTD